MKFTFLCRFLVFCCLLIFSDVIAESSVLQKLNANNDHGFWLEYNATVDLTKHWSLLHHQEYRWGADYRKFWHWEQQFIFQYSLLDFFSDEIKKSLKDFGIGPGYNATEVLSGNTLGEHHWVWLHKPMLETNLRVDCCKWQFINRLRFEYIVFTKKHYIDHATIRYRILIYTPWKWTCRNITPYVFNEWFFRENTYSTKTGKGLVGVWFENRLRIGIDGDLYGDILGVSLYWQWRTHKRPPEADRIWNNTYQIGLIFNSAF